MSDLKRSKARTNEHRVEPSPKDTAVYEAASLFIQTEKDLVAIGFFTPTRKGLKDTREKIVRFTRPAGSGDVVERSIKIVTGGRYGLPGTADLDKWLALQKLINDIKREQGAVTNPISFTTAELLSVLGVHKDSGKNYKGVEEWLDRMYATTIESQGQGLFSGQRRSAKDRLRVFERCVSVNRELEKGKIADRNYVWLSSWQLENINANRVIPIDFSLYLSLENPIAKTLLPLLQIWFYATRDVQVFEKRYDEFCQLLGIRQYPRPGLIEQVLWPSMAELERHGLLGGWRIEKALSGGGYKLILKHGRRFTERHRLRALSAGGVNGEWLAELTARGVEEIVARDLLREIGDDRPLLDQLDYIDTLIAQARGKITNPPGFIVSRLRKNIPLPADFGTRAEREAAGRAQAEELALATSTLEAEAAQLRADAERRARLDRLSRSYDAYRRAEIERYIGELPPAEHTQLRTTAKERVLEEQPELKVLKDHILDSFVTEKMIELAMPQVAFISFEEFAAKEEG